MGDEPEQINKSLSGDPTGQEACATGEAETTESVGDETESAYRVLVTLRVDREAETTESAGDETEPAYRKSLYPYRLYPGCW